MNMTKEEILKKHLSGFWIFPEDIPDEIIEKVLNAIYSAMEEYKQDTDTLKENTHS